MLLRRSFLLLISLLGCAASAGVFAQAVAGQTAPLFALSDVNGNRVQLADFRGQFVVLEWNNPSCPFVRKHYDSGNMQALQKRFTHQKIAWLTINSTAASHAEYLAPAQLGAWMKQQGGAPTAVLLDAEGRVGRAYGARTTPHMYVIDPQGKLAYVGAIDDKRSTNPADTKTARNFVATALTEAMAGNPVSTPNTQAYGCSVKYDG